MSAFLPASYCRYIIELDYIGNLISQSMDKRETPDMKTQKKVMQSLRKIYGMLDNKQKSMFLLILSIMAISAALSQFTPNAIGWLTDDILEMEDLEFMNIIPVLFLILIVIITNELLKISRRIMVEDVATKTEKKARGMVISSLLRAPLSFYRSNMTGNIHGRFNRCLEGTIKLEKLLFMDLAPAVFNSIAAIIVIISTLPIGLALPMLLVIPIGIAIVMRQIKTQKGIRVALLETKAGMDGSIVELLNGIELIRVLDSISLEQERFEGKSEFLRKKEMRHHLQMAKYDCLKFMNEAVFTVLMIGISTFLATRHIITTGAVLTSYLCFNQLLKPLEELHRILDELSESLILTDDFFKMVEIPCDFSFLPVKEEDARKEESENIIKISNLDFSYEEDRKILENFNLSVEKGMFLGIAGPSGCGKSSLIKALCKLEDYKGRIEICKRDLKTISRKELSSLIALVPQNPFIISATVYENLCYGLEEEPTGQKLQEAIRKAGLTEFIHNLPEGVHTMISEGGTNLSGGQKQRIAIARIFLRQPEILILDEATSALDNNTERSIQYEIEQMIKAKDLTVISIAHRLTTLKNATRIIVMDKGTISQDGTYDELIMQDGLFRSMHQGKLKQ